MTDQLADLRPWTRQTSRHVYVNPWISVREDGVILPNGASTIYGVVTLGPCVGIVPVTDGGDILLVRQYRYVQKTIALEMPTGKAHLGEDMEAAAQRELQEEVGYRARSLIPLCHFHTSKSVCDETAYLFLARGLESAPLPPDSTELLDVVALPFKDVYQMVKTSQITDSMTVIGVLHAASLLG